MRSNWSLLDCIVGLIWLIKVSIPALFVWALLVNTADQIGRAGREQEIIWLVVLLLVAWVYYWIGKHTKIDDNED